MGPIARSARGSPPLNILYLLGNKADFDKWEAISVRASGRMRNFVRRRNNWNVDHGYLAGLVAIGSASRDPFVQLAPGAPAPHRCGPAVLARGRGLLSTLEEAEAEVCTVTPYPSSFFA